jgi:hypothetical protein
VSAVDDDDQLDGAGPPEINQGVERRADGSARVQHIVDQEDFPVVDGKRDLGAPDERLRSNGVAHQIVAIERDIKRAGRHVVAVDFLECAGDAPRQRDPAGPDAHQRELVQPAVAFENLVRDARQHARHAVGVHYLGHGHLRPRSLADADRGCGGRGARAGEDVVTKHLLWASQGRA